MKFRPLGDRVVVRRVKEDTKTAGGIIIPRPLRRSRRKARSFRPAPALSTKRPASAPRWK